MARLSGVARVATAVVMCAGGAFLAGCSSSPDEAQMRRLDDLKKEYTSLENEASAKEATKASLEKEVAEKNARLKKCHDDEAIVKERLSK